MALKKAPRPYTREEDAAIRAALAAGLNLDDAADAVGRSVFGVAEYAAKKYGDRRWYREWDNRRSRLRGVPERAYYSPECVVLLRTMYRDGVSVFDAAARSNRTVCGIARWAQKQGVGCRWKTQYDRVRRYRGHRTSGKKPSPLTLIEMDNVALFRVTDVFAAIGREVRQVGFYRHDHEIEPLAPLMGGTPVARKIERREDRGGGCFRWVEQVAA